jgi:hypothetical protein
MLNRHVNVKNLRERESRRRQPLLTRLKKTELPLKNRRKRMQKNSREPLLRKRRRTKKKLPKLPLLPP